VPLYVCSIKSAETAGFSSRHPQRREVQTPDRVDRKIGTKFRFFSQQFRPQDTCPHARMPLSRWQRRNDSLFPSTKLTEPKKGQRSQQNRRFPQTSARTASERRISLRSVSLRESAKTNERAGHRIPDVTAPTLRGAGARRPETASVLSQRFV
jgi:hypothetical protein